MTFPTVYVTVERLHGRRIHSRRIFVYYRKESRRCERGKSDAKGEGRRVEGEERIEGEGRGKKTKRVSTYFVVDCDPRDRLCSRSGTPRSMLSVQGQRTGRAKTRVGTRRVHSIQRRRRATRNEERPPIPGPSLPPLLLSFISLLPGPNEVFALSTSRVTWVPFFHLSERDRKEGFSPFFINSSIRAA